MHTVFYGPDSVLGISKITAGPCTLKRRVYALNRCYVTVRETSAFPVRAQHLAVTKVPAPFARDRVLVRSTASASDRAGHHSRTLQHVRYDKDHGQRRSSSDSSLSRLFYLREVININAKITLCIPKKLIYDNRWNSSLLLCALNRDYHAMCIKKNYIRQFFI